MPPHLCDIAKKRRIYLLIADCPSLKRTKESKDIFGNPVLYIIMSLSAFCRGNNNASFLSTKVYQGLLFGRRPAIRYVFSAGRPRQQLQQRWSSGNSNHTTKVLTEEERNEAIRNANDAMKGYVETRMLAKQGKLKSKRGQSETTKSQYTIQLSILVTMIAAFVTAPFLGKKIATDEEFRKKYIPDWFDFRVRSPESAWTRKELHDQLVQVEQDLRERAIRGDFAPDKLEDIKRQLQPRSDLSEEDVALAKKYGWGRIHPGVDPDDDDYDEEDDE